MFHKRVGVESSRGCDNPSRSNDTIIARITSDSMPQRKVEKKATRETLTKERQKNI